MKTIAYDVERKRPGCVLIQAAMGATIPNYDLLRHFDERDWLLAPTDAMRVYAVTDEQLASLGEITRKART